MNTSDIIKELKEYCYKVDKKSIDSNKEIFKNYEVEFLDGLIGTTCNSYNESNKYEVYLFIGNKSDIACPLLYKTFDNPVDSSNYFEELKNLIENNNEKKIINRCKIRE